MDKVQAYYKNQIGPMVEKANDLLVKKVPQVEKLRSKGIKPIYAVAGALFFCSIVSSWLIGGPGLCNLVGFVYPLYASYKAIKSKETSDDTEWLTYWVVYSTFNLVESITDLLFHWIPFYYLCKCAFLVWCFLPQTKGANMIFKHGIDPLLSKYLPKLEKKANGAIPTVVKSVARTVAAETGGDNEKKSE